MHKRDDDKRSGTAAAAAGLASSRDEDLDDEEGGEEDDFWPPSGEGRESASLDDQLNQLEVRPARMLHCSSHGGNVLPAC